MDERLLARASSCTNMIPGETGWGRAGGVGQGEQLFNHQGWTLGLPAQWGLGRTPDRPHRPQKKM